MNETIKEKAQTMYPIESKAECHVAFLQGAELVHKGWIKIKRDKDGFYDGDVSDLFAYTPFIVRKCIKYEDCYDEFFNFVDADNFYEWAGDIGTHPTYTHLLPYVPEINDEQ
jgi:hypothetical protein